jgi:hypothetical protein
MDWMLTVPNVDRKYHQLPPSLQEWRFFLTDNLGSVCYTWDIAVFVPLTKFEILP